ncbi:MAG: cytochrome c [Proteobacteria bacterium]|nr:cytochrome c [Pseudomonadota bacterium]
MNHQPKLTDNGAGPKLFGGSANQPLVVDTVPRSASSAADVPPRPPATTAWLAHGKELFEINCSPCHGAAGDGDGRVVERGFPRPPSYHVPRLQAADARHFYDVITKGYGVMYPQGYRIPPTDRWAIVAYIRALQLSQSPKLAASLGLSKQRSGDVQ